MERITKIVDLIYLAKQNGIDIVLNGKRLQLRVRQNVNIDQSLLEEIRNNKEVIIDFLTNETWKVKSVKENHLKINLIDRKTIDHFPLSFSQERLWFLDQFDKGSMQYHVPAIWRLKGELNKEALGHALNGVVNRHEILRTVILEQDGRTFQSILDAQDWHLEIVDDLSHEHDQEGLQKLTKQLIQNPFDLSKDYMFRAHLIILIDQEYLLLITIHHIATDGWSMPIIVKEITELYTAFTSDRQPRLAPLPIQYADYALWQRNYLQNKVLDSNIDYWKNKLKNLIPLQLPTDYIRPSIEGIEGAAMDFIIEKNLSDQIQRLCKQEGATLFMTLLTAFKILLYRYSGQQDICVGTPHANRKQQEVEGLIGFFINTLVLRSEIKSDLLFTELLQQVKATTIEAYNHVHLPLEKIVEVVLEKRDLSRNPLFQVMLALQDTPEVQDLRLGEVQITVEEFVSDTSKFDFTFFINKTISGLQVHVEYSTALYSKKTIARMAGHFKALLCSIVQTPQKKISELKILTTGEEQQLLYEFNNSKVDYPKGKTIIDLFEERAAKTPEAIALVFGQKQLTYKELNERVNQLAYYLRSRGVKEETLVPICINKSTEMIIGIMGILKAGGAYIPVEPDYPEERIKFIVEDTKANLILTAERHSYKLGRIVEQKRILVLDSKWNENEHHPVTNLKIPIKPQQLAYIIYTSGSTGQPKGVEVEHISLLNHLFWFIEQYSITDKDSTLLITSFNFDGSMTSIWPVLIKGGNLHIPENDVFDPSFVLDYISNNSISYIKTLPSIFKALIQEDKFKEKEICKSLRLITVGGERMNINDLKYYINYYPDILFANHYGPTECTISSTFCLINKSNIDSFVNRSVIGKPVYNCDIFIVGKAEQLNPVGITGEICIGGRGVARGYLNNPQLTAKKFINNPFDKMPGERMYKTGDYGSWLPDGNIEYLGRKDDQVKIRGYRIELGEIESVLQQCESIRQVVILAREDINDNKRLIGYVVSKGVFDKDAIISYLKNKLPEYMVPVLWVELGDLPLTPNGKIDKKALPDPDASSFMNDQYVAPGNDLEIKLADIWKKLLGMENVGIHHNFFELGGHSLLAVRVMSAIRQEMKVELRIKDIFQYSTIKDLSKYIDIQTNLYSGKEISEFNLFNI